MRRPKTIWLLLVLFAFSLVQGATILVEQSESQVYQLFAAASVESVFFVLVVASVLLDGATLRYLWRPEPVGLRVGLASLAVGAAFAILAGLIAMAHPDLVRVLVIAAYEDSGRSFDPRAFELATSNSAIAARTAVTLAKVGLCACLLVWNRAYFEKQGQTPFSETREGASS
jgi:hypothetical protein